MAVDESRGIVKAGMTIATAIFEGVSTNFTVANQADVIQRVHSSGAFYELHQLVAHRNFIPLNCTAIDCGANVGNHTLFYSRHTLAARVYPLEANSESCDLLRSNIAANSGARAQIDVSNLGVAIGARRGRVSVIAR